MTVCLTLRRLSYHCTQDLSSMYLISSSSSLWLKREGSGKFSRDTGLAASFVHLSDFWYFNFSDTQSHYSYLADLLGSNQIIQTWASAGILCTGIFHLCLHRLGYILETALFQKEFIQNLSLLVFDVGCYGIITLSISDKTFLHSIMFAHDTWHL